MNAAPHIPVLMNEVLDHLAPAAGEIHVDGTFGAGGYTTSILAAADCHVCAIDRDPTAIERGIKLSAEFQGRLRMLGGCFGDMDQLTAEADVSSVDGVVLDIGVSSMQIDQADRGFSFAQDGPLDMRMSSAGMSAADFVNMADEEEIAHVIWAYGEERMSRRIARRIVERRREQPFERTGDLADLVRSVVRKGKDQIDPATRTFQGLRIHVNDELGELERGLAAAEKILKPGGRLVVVSFHSLEDRMVKSFFKDRADSAKAGRLLPGEVAPPPPSFRDATRKAVVASDAEKLTNPRARSAKLRAATRTENPPYPKKGDVR